MLREILSLSNLLGIRDSPPTECFADVVVGSREQNYRPEDCGTCHAVLTGRKGGGFWEGGKGT
jgi:hypothetical protein